MQTFVVTIYRLLILLAATALLPIEVCAQEPGPNATKADKPDPAGIAFFEKKIRPILIEKCSKCHAPGDDQKIRGGLRIDTRKALMTGGDSGPAIVPHKPEESLLVEALRYESFEMPPKGKLPDAVIADFVKWIEMGAPDPRVADEVTNESEEQGIDIEQGRQFWCYQPVVDPPLPELITPEQVSWPRDSIDNFILHRMTKSGLTPAKDAERAVLIRRLNFDLTGLPPTPEEIASFVNDPAEDDAAIATLVDRLLGSPRFGERWGRHWLDVARFSESTGGGRSMLYKEAWRYRDYVIDSFSSDKSYQQFVVEQLAGDLLPPGENDQTAAQLTATSFLALGPTNFELQDKVQLRMDVIDEQIDTTGRAFLGMTLGCARCHDHKFDPIPQSDYYALAGIFGSTKTFYDGNVAQWILRPLPATPTQEQAIEEHKRSLAKFELQQARRRQEIADLQQKLPNATLTIDDEQAKLVGNWTTSTSVKGFFNVGYRHATGDGKTATFTHELEPGRYQVRVCYTPGGNRSPNALARITHKDGSTEKRINQKQTPNLPDGAVSIGEYEFGTSATIVVSTEGTKEVVIADAIQFLRLDTAEGGEGADEQEAIAAILKKITTLKAEHDVQNKELTELKKTTPVLPEVVSVEEEAKPSDEPLCIRGNARKLGDKVPRGMLQVASTDATPTVPNDRSGRLQLANWIASQDNPLTARVYVNRVWSHLFGSGLVRTLDNFGTTGELPSHPQLLDHLAASFVSDGWSTKRLIRRIVLSRSYRMASLATPEKQKNDPDNIFISHQNRRRLEAEAIYDTMLSLSGELDLSTGGRSVREGTGSEYGYKFDINRRAVYMPVFRNELPELLSVFDFADPNSSVGKRNVTTLSTQALFLMNSPFVIERAKLAAIRISAREPDASARLSRLYLESIGRHPTDAERRIAEEFLQSSDETTGWSALSQALIASLEFRYVD